jgi:hypothetical protein
MSRNAAGHFFTSCSIAAVSLTMVGFSRSSSSSRSCRRRLAHANADHESVAGHCAQRRRTTQESAVASGRASPTGVVDAGAAYLDSFFVEIAVELLGFLHVLQAPLPAFSRLRVHKCDLLEARVVIATLYLACNCWIRSACATWKADRVPAGGLPLRRAGASLVHKSTRW